MTEQLTELNWTKPQTFLCFFYLLTVTFPTTAPLRVVHPWALHSAAPFQLTIGFYTLLFVHHITQTWILIWGPWLLLYLSWGLCSFLNGCDLIDCLLKSLSSDDKSKIIMTSGLLPTMKELYICVCVCVYFFLLIFYFISFIFISWRLITL